MRKTIILLVVLLLSSFFITAQNVTLHMYRKVEPADLNEYIKREVNYWSKFAEKEIKAGNMSFWALLVRVGGENMETEPNTLMIKTFTDIDKELDWNGIYKMFPNVKVNNIETESLFKTTSIIYLKGMGNHIQGPNIDPQKDFKYVRMNYFNLKDTWWHLNFEEQDVKPFFKKAMEDGITTLKGWGNSLVLTPKSEGFRYDTHSYDIFTTLNDAVSPDNFDSPIFPEGFFDEWKENIIHPREIRVYKVIKFVNEESVKE